MTKRMLVMLAVLVSLIASLNAKQLEWSSDAEDAYKDLNWKSWYSRSKFQTNSYNKKIQLVALKNNSSVKSIFSDFTIRKVDGKTSSDKRVKVSTIGTESCQCVAFVKEFTGYSNGTSNWIQGTSLLSLKDNDPKLKTLKIGSVIATFSNDSYDYRHTAIIVGKSGKGDWIEVIDQNWNPIIDTNFATREIDPVGAASPDCEWNENVYPFYDKNKKGFVMKHRIYFDNSYSGVNNAYNYSLVNIPD